jgi:effector-binding domain-containing protein
MQTKKIHSKNYFCFIVTTTLNSINEVALHEVDPLFAEAGRLQLKQAGPLEFIYWDCSSDRNKPFTLWIALPVMDAVPLEINHKYSFKDVSDFKCASYVHKGSIAEIGKVYGNIFAEIFELKIQPTNQIREVYQKYEALVSPENITEIQIGIL